MIDKERDFDREESGQRRPMGETGPTGSPMDRGTSGNLVDLAQQRGSQLGDKAQQTTSDVMDQAREQASLRASEQKDRVSETLRSVAGAVRQTGTQLRAQDQMGVAEYADRAAEQLERFSGYLGENDVQDMAHEVERFARRQPLLFVGGTLLLGFMGARFLMSSAPPSQSGSDFGHQVPRYRVPARQGYPDTPRRTFGTAGERTPGTYPGRTYPTTPGTASGTGSMPGTDTSTGSTLNTPPKNPEDSDAAA